MPMRKIKKSHRNSKNRIHRKVVKKKTKKNHQTICDKDQKKRRVRVKVCAKLCQVSNPFCYVPTPQHWQQLGLKEDSLTTSWRVHPDQQNLVATSSALTFQFSGHSLPSEQTFQFSGHSLSSEQTFQFSGHFSVYQLSSSEVTSQCANFPVQWTLLSVPPFQLCGHFSVY